MSLIQKLIKPGGAKADELETQVEKAFLDLEAGNSDVKAQLRELHFVGAKEIDVGSGRKALIVYVPVPQLKQYQKIQARLVIEFEKKFSGSHVLIVAKRRVLSKPKRGRNQRDHKQKRPRSRTLTAVHESLLGDLVHPAEIVGKRIRVKLDGRRLTRVHLDKSQQTNLEHKIDTFSAVYKHLAGKDVVFEFPEPLF